jgi:hypothetical protein
LVFNREFLKKAAKNFFGIGICGTFTLLAAHPAILQTSPNRLETN